MRKGQVRHGAVRGARAVARGTTALAALLALAAQAEITSVGGYTGSMDRVLTVQPILVCDDNGSNCADKSAMFKDFLIPTYAQIGIAVAVLPWKSINDSASLTGIDARTDIIVFPTQGASSAKKTLNAWFVNDLVEDPVDVIFGVGALAGNSIVIDTQAVLNDTDANNVARPRRDTFAHEIGHNLGLLHDTYGAGNPDNLMTAGKDRSIPSSGFTDLQIAAARASLSVTDAPLLSFTQSISSGFDADATSLNVRFDQLPEGVSLRRMTIDLPDANLPSPLPGTTGRPYEYLLDYQFRSSSRPDLDHFIRLNGYPDGLSPICASDDQALIQSCYGENTQAFFPTGDPNFPQDPVYLSTGGAPEIDILFGAAGTGGSFGVGDEFTLDLMLRPHLMFEEVATTIPWLRDFDGATITLEYDFGLVTQGVFAADGTWNSRRVTGIGSADYEVTPFGAVYGPGEARPTSWPVDLDPVPRQGAAVPLPGSWALVLAGGAAAALSRRCRRRCRS